MSDSNQHRVDLEIRDGLIVTADEQQTIIERGCVYVKDGVIVNIGPADDNQPALTAAEVIDASHHLVMPGLINGHTHAATVLFRGFADDKPLGEWLEDYIWPAEGAFIEPESVYWATLLAIIEMIKGGVTTVLDMYFHEDVVARAVEMTGIRAMLGEVLFDVAGPVNAPFPEGLARTEELLQAYVSHPLISPSVQPHSTYAVSSDNLVRAKALADDYGVLFGLHAAETSTEVSQVHQETGYTPIRLLDHLNLLTDNVVVYHGVHLDDTEIDLLARTGAAVVHCPEANLKLGSGIAPVPALRRRGVDVGLGTDGPASNNDFNLWGEIQMAAKLARGVTCDLTAIDAYDVIGMATWEGARALGLGNRIGSLQPGHQADIVLINLDQPHLTPLYDPVSHLAYAVGRSDVSTSIINGRVVMRNGELKTVDEHEVTARVREIASPIAKWLADR